MKIHNCLMILAVGTAFWAGAGRGMARAAAAVEEPVGIVMADTLDMPEYYDLAPDTMSYRLFQYSFLSAIAATTDTTDIEYLVSPQEILPWMLMQLDMVVDRDISCIKGEKVDVHVKGGGTPSTEYGIVVWTLPEPREILDCKFVAFMPWGDHFRLFTLEKTLVTAEGVDDPYIVCEAKFRPSDGWYDHCNYGVVLDNQDTDETKFVFYVNQIARLGQTGITQGSDGKAVEVDFTEGLLAPGKPAPEDSPEESGENAE